MDRQLGRDDREKIIFTSFCSILVHALLLFGIAFSPAVFSSFNSIELVLLKEPAEAPAAADFRARHAQAASGTDPEDIAPRIQRLPIVFQYQGPSPFPLIGSNAANTPASPGTVTESIGKKNFSKTADSEFQLKSGAETKANSRSELAGLDSSQLAAAAAKVEAYIGELRRELASKPKIRRYTSIAAKKAVEADYVHNWVKKVEAVGNLNYPDEAIKRNLSGNLRLLVVLSSTGDVLDMLVLQSSGEELLDSAARNIVRLASPFAEFPHELKQEADIVEILRTWKFRSAGDIKIQGANK